jgi:hypothetical protein
MLVRKRLTIDITGLVMLAEGEPKPHSRQTQSICGAPVAGFGIWVGPFYIQGREMQADFDVPIDN